ncbi:geranylgeranyl pyrophosphate synthetase [Xylaria sp. FL0933]|nr:geranylgeranyl pyrophosphate synthetase [Xylaria sp. FL0933]
MAAKTSVRISRENLTEQDDRAAIVEDVKHLASYSWIEAAAPTIAVPGAPPRWSPPAVPTRLQKDSGLVYISQNAARHPESPLEPLFRSLYVVSPDFDIRGVDVITDRNNIRKLLSFIDPSSSRNGLEPFVIMAEAIDNTLLMARIESKTSEVIAPHEFKGFGHEYEKAYTRCQLANTTGYTRIVSYHFSGLSFVIRHEVDGYVSQPTATPSSRNRTDTDGLAGLLGSLSLSTTSKEPPKTRTFRPSGSRMTIREEGIVVPLDSTLEIKTRVSHKRLNIHEIAPQLWVSQTPKLVRAYHKRGVFEATQVEDVEKEIKAWERTNQKHLKRLAALIKAICTAVRACGGKAEIRYDTMTDKIMVTPKVGAKRMLPDDLYSNWGPPEAEAGVEPATDRPSGKRAVQEESGQRSEQ